MFEDLKDGARIFSSKAFSPVHFRITGNVFAYDRARTRLTLSSFTSDRSQSER